MKFQVMKRGCAALLALLFILGAFLSPMKSYAHEAYFFQVLIDENQYLYQGNILADDSGWLGSETGHMEAQFGNFSDLTQDYYPIIPQKGEKVSETKLGQRQAMPFTFSPEEKGDAWFDGKPVNDATKQDVDRAYFIKDTLIPSLNDALRILNNNKEFEDIGELLEMSSQLGNAIKNNGYGKIGDYSIRKGRASYSSSEPNLNKKTGIQDTDYITISKTEGNKTVEYEFVYQVVKGYKSKGNWDNKVYNSAYDHSGDAEYMTWNMVMYQAVYAYSAKGMTAKDGAEIAKPGALEEAVTWMFESLYNGIRNLLGLFSLDELIYNDGIRGSSAWQYGVMPMSWEKNVMLYHWIFQAIAWTIISFSIAKLLITRNIATINPSMRVSLIEGLQDLLITGLMLAFVMPIINLLMNFNMKIVDVFAAVGPDLDKVMGVNNYSNLLAGVIIQFFFLFIAIYLNLIYILRSITVAILTAMAPLFVVTLSMGGKWKGLFSQWMKELVSNIFLQSFHAFVLGFLFLSTISSRGIEAVVVCFSLIPLTEFFRSMIMGQAGGIASRVGLGTVAAGATLAMGAGQKAMSMGQKGVQNSNTQSTSKSQSGSYSNFTGGSSEIKTGSSDRFRTNGDLIESRTKHQDTRNAQLQKQVPFGVASKGSDSNEYKEFMGGSVMSEDQAQLADMKDNFKSDLKSAMSGEGVKSMAVGAGKSLVGATAMAAGAGYALAFGAENSGAILTGSKIAGAGGRMGYDAGKAGISKVAPTVLTGTKLGGAVAGDVAATVGNSKPVQSAKDGVSSLGTAIGTKVSNTGSSEMNAKIAQAVSNSKVGQAVVGALRTPQKEDLERDNSGGYSILSNNIGQRTIGNDGDYQVFRDGVTLSEQGILRASENSDGTSVYAYDMSKLKDGDKENINHYANVFEGQDQAQIVHLKQSGIESAWKNHDGSVGVAYNNVGKEKLGIKKVEMIGGNILETKRANQSGSTKVSIDAEYASAFSPQRSNYQARQERRVNSNSNKTENKRRPTPMQ
ncbi:hypothetical protein SMD22_00105 (plasmid) [Brevibacillus halotolerans]|nr:hypothetical protein SMD22_00105 [Brevibacillus halotolerans]